MTGNVPTPEEQPVDLAVLAADTMLLDVLGRGEPAPDDDTVAAMLAAWRADLAVDPADIAGTDTVVATASPSGADDTADLTEDLGAGAGAATGAGTAVDPTADPAVGPTQPLTVVGGRAGSRGRIPATRWLAGAAAAVLLAGGGLAVAANHATPGSPLWPITRVMYPEQADIAAAEQAVAQARRAATEGRYDDARRLIARAETLISRVHDPRQAQRLRAELDAVRALLPVAEPVSPATPTPGTPTPGTSPPAGGGPAPAPTAPGPTPGGGATTAPAPGLPLPPILPSVGVSPLPLPLPTPTGGLLPSLPLPSLPVVGNPTLPIR
jgi:hypothetical protein